MVDFNKYSDEELMKEIKVDNMLAFDVFYNRYIKRLYKFAFSILKTQEDTENIIQDVYMSLWINRKKVEKESSVKYYLFSIAYNSTITLIRKRVKEFQYIEYLKSLQTLNQEPVDLEIEYMEMTDKLNNIIDALPERQKEIYKLLRVEGLKYSEIAKRLNISIKTVETHVSRALRTVRQKMGNYALLSILFWYLFV